MNSRNPRTRRILRDCTRLASVVSAVMMMVSVSALLDSQNRASAAGERLGAVTFRTPEGGTIAGGGSEPFAMSPPANAACPGGASSVPSYRWQAFLVSASVDPGAMTYTGAGPAPITGAFVSPMYDPSGVAIISQNPAATPTGLISGIPTFAFSFFEPAGTLPAGSYTVGFACTTGGATVSYWSAPITIAANAADSPAGIAWTTSATVNSTTTTVSASSTSSTVAGNSTTTTVRPTTATTTTTIASATSSTTSSPTTTTTTTALLASGGPTSTFATAFQPSSGGFSSGSGIPVTGPSHAVTIAVWAILMLVFGRMAVLMARPVKVLPPEAR